ncbi:MAG: helix-turn-helix domain-containing protein [Richelia sp. RM2_1_2]|nr:helix-turn-helix domain-containing protein [Richelia sp. SM2_1_7]NJM18258.1 helix-turn-helix domain-containing protein [Richelia sp. SM1_7_0]NJN07173.1 helix-turn-helix domain-containing protein [Richelia sp. RM1_1_1]NJO29111.1 helix-turn-helix domain-containing protein [Richelia sp. SL_2_1]NJO57864.1 helix-turn-helix domain-containing protein [Richelia sp. RM2_1_2]
MYVSTSQAAEILNISNSRMRYLIAQGRVKGAYKAGKNWIIPLFEGNPIISRGSRGPKAKWCRRNPATTKIHVNRHRIQQNLKQQNSLPVITVKHRTQNIYGFSVKINGPCEIVYRPEKPLSCGAVVWVETHSSVEVECGKSNQENSFIVSTG